jgi:hypothetical protein
MIQNRYTTVFTGFFGFVNYVEKFVPFEVPKAGKKFSGTPVFLAYLVGVFYLFEDGWLTDIFYLR